MGMRITGAEPTLNMIRPAGTSERSQLVNPEFRPLGANRDQEGSLVPFNRRETEIPRAGFGDGTVSGPAAAVRTLRNGLRQARSIIPSREEVRERIRDRMREEREWRAERLEARLVAATDLALGTSSPRSSCHQPQRRTTAELHWRGSNTQIQACSNGGARRRRETSLSLCSPCGPVQSRWASR